MKELEKPKILWGQDYKTDRKFEHHHPDIVILCPNLERWKIMVIDISTDQNIAVKGNDKIVKYLLSKNN